MSGAVKDEGSFTWLHVTDLHAGMQDQDWLWPTFKSSFFEDLKIVQESAGPIDTVVFSGDLTQAGTKKDFDKLDSILSELWEVFDKQGTKPTLLVTPGNHDVQWPEALEPSHEVLKQWWNIPKLNADYFANADNPYRLAVNGLLQEFSSWQDRATGSAIPTIKPVRTGLLPGDQSVTIQKGTLKVGFVFLNSTWLQIDGDDYLGKLHVDARQLHKVTDESPVTWCSAHHLNILVTHHPVDWLHPDSQAFWDSDINPAKRFDVHLYGHMHSAAGQAVSAGGGATRRAIQGASLFGLRTVQKKLDRIHGYSVGRASRIGNGIEVRVWPRILAPRQDGSKALGRDQRFEVRESDGSYGLIDKQYRDDDSVAAGNQRPTEQSTALQIPTTHPDEVLKRVRYHLPLFVAHINVRRVEQQSCVDALSAHRCLWLISDWGMGEDGFLSSVKHSRGHTSFPTFRIDLSDFKSRDQMFDSLKNKLGCSIDHFSEIISTVGITYIFFDDFPVSGAQTDGHGSLEAELEEIVSIILEFCPQLNVLIKSRRAPQHHIFPIVEIDALDPADLKTYVFDHEKGGPDRATTATVSALHRHTDGIPTRVDQALKHLEVVTLSELLSSNTDLVMATPVGGRFHPGLVRSLRELAESSDGNQRRVFGLLKALMIFPQGEQLSRIKRFNLNAPFHLHHAEELLDRSLIEVTTLQRIESTTPDTQARTLVVPRQTRDCLREMMDPDEFRDLNQKAAELYFGDRWKTGIMKPRPSYRFDNPNCPIGDVQNASAIIVRLFSDASEQVDQREIERSLGLAYSFLGALLEGDHFSGAVNFSEQLLPLISEEIVDHRANLLSGYGRALRMIGEVSKARDVLSEIAGHPFPSAAKQFVLLNLALCYQSLADDEEAKEYAQLAISIDRHSSAALHAQSILIELDDDEERRSQRLAGHEAKCRRQKAFVVANNIALRRARESSDQADVQKILEPVMRISNDNKDHYNQTRAIIELAQLELRTNSTLGEKEMVQLMKAYYFLFNERLPSLFDRCHDALWKGFAARNDPRNLTSLFRYSSLYWRLRGHEDHEKRYIEQLMTDFGSALLAGRSERSTREAVYLSVRAKAVGLLPAPTSPVLPPSTKTERCS
jgi:tetratricopeptide (TPR) repeat protein